MMLSFSIPAMRVMIEAGLRERAVTGFPPQDASGRAASAASIRTKRQTIRARGPAWQRVLKASEGGPDKGGRVDRDLHLWWKSRTPAREKLGTVRGFEIFPLTIEHRLYAAHAECHVSLPGGGLARAIEPANLRACREEGRSPLFCFAFRDGFDEWLDFVNFFVPNPGDRFPGALIRW